MRNITIIIMILFNSLIYAQKQYKFVEGTSIPIVEISIGEKIGMFIVDTGSSHTYLSKSYIEGLSKYVGKKYSNELTYSSLSEDITTISYKVKVSIEGYDTYLSVIDMSKINKSIEPLKIIGIIGTDFLRQTNAFIDYKNKKLIINN